MKKISEAALKKAILAVEAERLKNPPAFRPDHAQQATLQKSRRALDKMVSGFLSDAGLDIRKFQALQEQRSVELERMVAKHKADALRRASRQKDTLQSRVLEQTKALRDLASRKDFFPYPTFTLDKPFLIWSIPLQEISDSAAVPFGSWAKFKFATSQYRGSQKFGFYFYWVNSYNDYAVITPLTCMLASGHLKSHAPWTVGVNTSLVQAFAFLNLWFGWPNDVTSLQHGGVLLGQTGAFGSFTGGETRGTSISSGVSLYTTMFAVPPGDVVVFEVALLLEYENDSGDIEADFESGDFQISCPVVVLSLLNSPPGVMA
jgi:hypothetical protein